MAKKPNEVGGLLKRLDEYPEHLNRIGLIVTDFAALEGRLCLLFWVLLDDAARGNAVFWALGSSKARCDIIRSLGREVLRHGETHKKLLAELTSCIEACRRVADTRNDIAHGQWGTPATGGPDPFVSISRPATKTPVFHKIYSLTELQEVADRISALELRIGLLTSALEYYLYPARFKAIQDKLRAQCPSHDTYFQKYE